MHKLLVVVDMQNDFVTGPLGTPEAQAIAENVREKILKEAKGGSTIVYTMDTHGEDYLQTQEGKNLPVPHCQKGSDGWRLLPALEKLSEGHPIFEKPSFGSPALAHYAAKEGFEEVELIGVCTDICVISNALLLKAVLPEAPVTVDAACCAGVTPQSHENALQAMAACQIQICK